MVHFRFSGFFGRISKICLLLAALSIGTAESYAQPLGQWTGVIPLPAIPIAAALLPNGKVLGWSAYDLFLFEGDVGDSPSDTYVFVRGSSGATSLRKVTNTGADMFCPGTAFLPNGNLLVNGGSSSPKTSIYNPSTNKWSSDAEMNVGRAYNGDVVLDNGNVFTLGGSWAGNATLDKIGELWAPGQGWTRTRRHFGAADHRPRSGGRQLGIPIPGRQSRLAVRSKRRTSVPCRSQRGNALDYDRRERQHKRCGPPRRRTRTARTVMPSCTTSAKYSRQGALLPIKTTGAEHTKRTRTPTSSISPRNRLAS